MRVKCTNERCGFSLVPCANGCKEQTMRNNLDLHQNERCPLRRYTCKHCKSEGTYKEMTGGHLDECPDLMVPCPHKGCEDGIKRKQMASHHLECPYEFIGCPYKDVGCAYTSPRGTMDDHKATSCGCHLDLAMVLLRNLDLKVTSCKDDLVQKQRYS